MRPFPGKLKRTREGYQLNGWQRKWIHEVFPTHTNKEIYIAIGICEESFKKLLRTLSDMEKDYDWRYYDHANVSGNRKDVPLSMNAPFRNSTALRLLLN